MSTDWSMFKPKKTEDFDTHVAHVLKIEGGEVDDPDDRGGHTKYGISQRSYPKLDISKLTVDDAKEIYFKDYWMKIGAAALPEELRGVAFDAAINQGVGWTKRALKEAGGDVRAFIDLRRRRYEEIVAVNPSQKKFKKGWMNRLREFEPEEPTTVRWELYKPKTVDWSMFKPKGGT
jgi:hypothetical protein